MTLPSMCLYELIYRRFSPSLFTTVYLPHSSADWVLMLSLLTLAALASVGGVIVAAGSKVFSKHMHNERDSVAAPDESDLRKSLSKTVEISGNQKRRRFVEARMAAANERQAI